jgi:hypothetical protein
MGHDVDVNAQVRWTSDGSWRQYDRLTVTQARGMSLRALQEHIYWVGIRRSRELTWRNAEPGFPWWPHRMTRESLIDAVGDWASVFDLAGDHTAPPANIVLTRPSLLAIDKPSLVIHVRGASVEDLDRGAEAAAQIFIATKADPYAAASAYSRRDMESSGADSLTDREHDLASAWDDAEVAAAEACCANWTNPPFGRADLHILDNNDADIEFLLGFSALAKAG